MVIEKKLNAHTNITFIRYELSSVGLVGHRGSSGWKSINLPLSLQQETGNTWPEVLFLFHGVPLKSVKLFTPQQWSCPFKKNTIKNQIPTTALNLSNLHQVPMCG